MGGLVAGGGRDVLSPKVPPVLPALSQTVTLTFAFLSASKLAMAALVRPPPTSSTFGLETETDIRMDGWRVTK